MPQQRDRKEVAKDQLGHVCLVPPQFSHTYSPWGVPWSRAFRASICWMRSTASDALPEQSQAPLLPRPCQHAFDHFRLRLFRTLNPDPETPRTWPTCPLTHVHRIRTTTTPDSLNLQSSILLHSHTHNPSHPHPRYLVPFQDGPPSKPPARGEICTSGKGAGSSITIPSHVWLFGRIRPPVTRGFHKPHHRLDLVYGRRVPLGGCPYCYSRCGGRLPVRVLAIASTRSVSDRFPRRPRGTRISPVMRLYSVSPLDDSRDQRSRDVT